MHPETPDSSDPQEDAGSAPDTPEASEDESSELSSDSAGDDGTARPFTYSGQAFINSKMTPAFDVFKRHNQTAIDSVLAAARKYYEAPIYVSALPNYLSGLEAVVSQLAAYPSLSRSSDFAKRDSPAGSYSAELTTPGKYFEATERKITSFEKLNYAISELIGKTADLPLVWRGVSDADWGLYSSLYRHLVEKNGVRAPQDRPSGDQPYPDEDQMVDAEKEVLRIARTDWRFDDLSALEIFARLQHVGGPTRLIDVTKNPYVAAWFAVEYNEAHEEKDARLFALATKPVRKDGKPEPPDGAVHLDSLGASREPFWHHLTDLEARQGLDWGTGARRRLWIPPSYDSRISAQNAAFILDGVPMTSAKASPYFPVGNGRYWKRADILAASSIYTRMLSATRKPQFNAHNFAPTFSFRITAEAKKEIRDVMESRFGYRASYIYPDMQGLAEHLKKQSLALPPDVR